MKLSQTLVYVSLGCIVPGFVTYSVRYLGQGAAKTNAMVTTGEITETIDFPELSVSMDHSIELSDEAGHERVGLSSPFWFEEFNEELYVDQYEVSDEPRRPVEDRLPELLVTSILPHPTNPLAMINSKPHRIGDEIEGVWKLTAIDGVARTVTVVHKSGKSVTFKMSNMQ